MTKLDELESATFSVDPQLVVSQLLATLLAMLSIALLPSDSFAQGLSLNLTNDLVPSIDPASRAITTLESDFGAYDQRQIESLEDLGRLNLSTGEHQQALVLFKQALHVARINQGLYHASQISIVDDIISAEISLQNWEEVNNYYDYQEHLYRRLYGMDDSRLEAGLRKVSAWHITALNVNLDGNRIKHLRKVNKLFRLRMQIAENTLTLNDPRFAMLARNIETFERELFLSSDLNREMLIRQQKDPLSRRNSFRQSDRRFVVTND
jgi:tetratricopeptide (TPR) repeat protein